MLRRDVLTLIAGTAAAVPFAGLAAVPTGWKRYEVSATIDPVANGPVTVWLPMPMETPYQRVEMVRWQSTGDAALYRDDTYGAQALRAEFSDPAKPRNLTASFTLITRDRAINLKAPGRPTRLDPDEAKLFLSATPTMPLNGLVGDTAKKIVAGKKGDVAKAKAIYEWIVENTFRDPKTRGCGTGDIRFMLESGNLSGKCADINSLFVGLARASGIPARNIQGIRVGDSTQFKSLGKSGDITKAQHCRAEFYAAEFGWVPVDPADVRKAVLEEEKPLTDPAIQALRKKLFGAWEMNWTAYNYARDLVLPPASGDRINHFMYPEGLAGTAHLDELDPDGFKYKIASKVSMA